jgi:hypothetical protein
MNRTLDHGGSRAHTNTDSKLVRRLAHLLASSRASSSRMRKSAVVFDGDHITLNAVSMRGAVTARRIRWNAIRFICFKDNGPGASDLIYLSTGPVEIFAIPIECDGGRELWRALRDRGAFPALLHDAATMSMGGGIYCWLSDRDSRKRLHSR